MSTELAVPGDGDSERPVTFDQSYDVELDPVPEPAPAQLVDPRPEPGARLPVIPDHLRTRAGLHAAARRQADLHWHRAKYHGIRSPRYLLLTLMWAVAGVFRIGWKLIHWWQFLEQQPLRSEAAAAGDDKAHSRMHKEAKETRLTRGLILLGGLIGIVIAGALALHYLPPWAVGALIGTAVTLLARVGRPADRPIISSATVTGRFRRLNADIVLRAYYSAGLGHPDKPGQQITFGGPMHRDGEGSRVLVDLPYGKGLKDAVEAKDKIASGLDVTESQVFLHRDPTSYRRHTLWVADRDPLALPVGRTPLLACRATDIWKPAPLGLDERGQLVRVPLMWNSVLVGALPRQGKTFSARQLALYCALDPFVKMSVFDGKGSPDWRKFALVADSCAFGLTPTKDGLPPEILLDALTELKDDVQRRYERLSQLEAERPDLCREGKLTRAIARDKRFAMPVRVLIIDEVQEYFDLGDISKEISALLVFMAKVAPGAGVSVLVSTQKPSGIGTGQIAQQFTSFRDQMQIRFSLRTSSWQVSEMVLGQGAYSEGLDSSTLLPQYKGVGILRGATDASPTVRTYLADGQDAEKILTAARAMREQAGTLSGMALGERAARERVSILADVLAVMGDAPAMHWEVLAPLLMQRFPERHESATARSVSAQCVAAGVASVDVKYLGRSRMGCRREHLEAAIRDGQR